MFPSHLFCSLSPETSADHTEGHATGGARRKLPSHPPRTPRAPHARARPGTGRDRSRGPSCAVTPGSLGPLPRGFAPPTRPLRLTAQEREAEQDQGEIVTPRPVLTPGREGECGSSTRCHLDSTLPTPGRNVAGMDSPNPGRVSSRDTKERRSVCSTRPSQDSCLPSAASEG